jgi:hypothetical protein
VTDNLLQVGESIVFLEVFRLRPVILLIIQNRVNVKKGQKQWLKTGSA